MEAAPTNSNADRRPRTPERTRGKNSYAEIAGGGKRGHPSAPAVTSQQNSRNDDDGAKAPSPFQSPNAKIQKRESNELVSSRSNSNKGGSRREPSSMTQSSDSNNRSSSFHNSSRRGKSNTKEKESDPKRLAARQKQIDFGKNTIGYQRYTADVSRNGRTHSHPWTPDRDQICSKRSWDGQVRKWRRALHEYDPPGTKYEDENGDAAAGDDDLQPDEGLLADDSRAPSASASASASASSLQNGVAEPKRSSAPQRKLMWSDVAEDDEVEMPEMQPPPSHVRSSGTQTTTGN